MLSNFFTIIFPYGIKKNEKGEWFAFNKRFKPVGWNDNEGRNIDFSQQPVFTIYIGLSDDSLRKIIKDKSNIGFDSKGKIKTVFFYNDETIPTKSPDYWDQYMEIIKGLVEYQNPYSNTMDEFQIFKEGEKPFNEDAHFGIQDAYTDEIMNEWFDDPFDAVDDWIYNCKFSKQLAGRAANYTDEQINAMKNYLLESISNKR